MQVLLRACAWEGHDVLLRGVPSELDRGSRQPFVGNEDCENMVFGNKIDRVLCVLHVLLQRMR